MNLNAEYEVIVHPSGLLDSDGAGYWTEVVALPSCLAVGQTVEEAIAKTREAIECWLAKASEGNASAGNTNQVDLKITIAY